MKLSLNALAAAAIATLLATPAFAGSAHVEWLNANLRGGPPGETLLEPGTVTGFGEDVTTNTSSAVQSSQAPAFAASEGYARVTARNGAVIVAPSGTASASNGWLVPRGRTILVPIAAAGRLSLLEDPTAAADAGVSCSNCATAAGQTTANASLAAIDTAQGAKADAVAASDTGTYSEIALLKRGLQSLTTLQGYVDQLEGYVDGLEAAIAALPQNNVLAAGSNLVGKVGIDQTTPGTTNQVSAVQNGAWTLQPGNTANTTPWRVNLSDGTNDTSYAASGADDVTNTAAGPRVYARCNIFDGSTWDRCRSMQGAAGDGAGVAATGNYLLKAVTYRYATTVSPASTATDIAVLSASSTKTVWVTQVCVTGIQTTGGFTPVVLNTHSTLDTGGTGVAISATKMAQSQASATATFTRYTANPTVGTVAGALAMKYVMIPAAAGSGANGYCWDFGARGAPVVLAAGSTQELAVNLNSQTLSGGSITVEMETVEF